MTKENEELNIKYLSYVTNLEKYTDRDKPTDVQIYTSTLPSSEKRSLYIYDCDVTPICDNPE